MRDDEEEQVVIEKYVKKVRQGREEKVHQNWKQQNLVVTKDETSTPGVHLGENRILPRPGGCPDLSGFAFSVDICVSNERNN
jgi:hypothetical protein